MVMGNVIVGGVSDTLDHSLETVLGIGGVLDNALGAIGLVQRVHSLDVVSVAVLPGLLVVAGVRVLDSVLELVRDRRVLLLVVVVVVVASSVVVAHLLVEVGVALGMTAGVGGHGGYGDSGQDADLGWEGEDRIE